MVYGSFEGSVAVRENGNLTFITLQDLTMSCKSIVLSILNTKEWTNKFREANGPYGDGAGGTN